MLKASKKAQGPSAITFPGPGRLQQAQQSII